MLILNRIQKSAALQNEPDNGATKFDTPLLCVALFFDVEGRKNV